MSVVEDLAVVRGAVTGLAFAMVDQTARPVTGFGPLLDCIDGLMERWDGGAQDSDDFYRLGLVVGTLAHMAACRVDADGTLTPMPVVYPDDNPVAQAAEGVRFAVLGFTAPATQSW